MKTRHLARLALGVAIALFSTQLPYRADLFALGTGSQIHRIDTATLAITHTYPNPFGGPPVSPAFSGMAFDGRILTWTTDFAFAGITELQQFDVVAEVWLPPIPAFDVPPPDAIAGLGYLGEAFGGAFLGVTRSRFPPPVPEPHPPAVVYRIEPFGLAMPLGELPPEYRATGLDVDPATGEIWVSVQNATIPRVELLHIGVSGLNQAALVLEEADHAPSALALPPGVFIQNVLLPPVPPLSIRGLGFDSGQMFAISTNRILYEIDRATGEILRSAELQVSGVIAGLAGGTVVPEPDAAFLIAAAIIAALANPARSPQSFDSRARLLA